MIVFATRAYPGATKLFRNVDVSSLELEDLFNASPNAYVLLDTGLNIVGCNPAYLTAVGRTLAEILGRNIFDAFPAPVDGTGYRLLRLSLDKVLETRQTDYLAVIPYDTSKPGQPPALRYWSATHTPVFDRQGALRYVLQHTVDITELQLLRQQSGEENIDVAGVLHRAHEVQASNLAMLSEKKLLRDMFQQAPGFVGVLAGPEHRFILANEAYMRLAGGRDLVGLTVAEALPEVVQQGFVEVLDEVYRSGEPYRGSDEAVLLTQPGGQEPERHYLDFIYQPIFSDDGTVTGIFVQGHDVTAKVEAERLHVLRQRELGHRLKNQLSVVQAIVAQTLRTAPSLSVAREVIAGRVQALATAHDLLIQGVKDKGPMRELVAGVLDFLDEDRKSRIQIHGEELEIGSRPALSLALLLHELATNAVKHGSLSSEQGAVSIAWGVRDTPDQAFYLTWQETGGPETGPPSQTGAGTKLIDALVQSLGGDASIEYLPSGLSCTLTCEESALSQ